MGNKKAYMIVGCPGSGKTWVAAQLEHLFDYVHHDLYIGMAGDTYVKEIMKRAGEATKPLLIEAPFSVSQIKDPLEAAGLEITPVFIQEDRGIISDRYMKRENKEIPKGHLTRQETYRQRADEWKSFKGTSSQVLEHLKSEANSPEHAPAHTWETVHEAAAQPEAAPEVNIGGTE